MAALSTYRNQGRNIDFGNAPSTRPEDRIVSSGDLPTGRTLFNLGAPAVKPLRLCGDKPLGGGGSGGSGSGVPDSLGSRFEPVWLCGLPIRRRLLRPAGVVVSTTDAQILTNKEH